MHLAQQVAVSFSLAMASAVAAAEPGPSAREIAGSIEKVYATCRTYRDSATVTRLRPGGSIQPDTHAPRQVKTAFKRGNALRFEYRDPNIEGRTPNAGDAIAFVLWANGGEVKTFPSDAGKTILKQERNDPSVVLAIWTGITERTSTMVPPLLLQTKEKKLDPEPGFAPRPGATRAPDNRFGTMYGDAERLKNETIGKVDCYVLRKKVEAVNFEDKSTFKVMTTFWIDSNSFLIRRVETEMFRAITRIEYQPAADINLDATELEFAPPR